MEKRVFGELEWAILQLFKAGQRLTVKEVLAALNSNDKYTTIMTVMNRLVGKKVLARSRIGLQYEYWICNKAQKRPPQGLLDKLREKVFGGNSASMISYLLESHQDITDVELEEMEDLIKKLKKARKQL